jgi:hypothetical protein
MRVVLAVCLLISLFASATSDGIAQPTANQSRRPIRVITDVFLPPAPRTATAPLNLVFPGNVYDCPTGYQRTNFSGQFAICQGPYCSGRRPLCVQYQTINPDALLARRPSVTTQRVVTRVRQTKGACGTTSFLAGKMPDCSATSCNTVNGWNICADIAQLNLNTGGPFLSKLWVTTHGFHSSPPSCPAGMGRSAAFVDGGGGFLSGYQLICQASSSLKARVLAGVPQPPLQLQITEQPVDQISLGEPVTFSVGAVVNRNIALLYQWQQQTLDAWVDVRGETGSSFTTEALSAEELQRSDGGSRPYRVKVTAPGAQPISVVSQVARVTFQAPPQELPPARIDCNYIPEWVIPDEKAGVYSLQISPVCSVNRPVPLETSWKVCVAGIAAADSCYQVPNCSQSNSAETACSSTRGGALSIGNLFQVTGVTAEAFSSSRVYLTLSATAQGIDGFQSSRILVLPDVSEGIPPIAPVVIVVIQGPDNTPSFWGPETSAQRPTDGKFRVLTSINRRVTQATLSFQWQYRDMVGNSRGEWQAVEQNWVSVSVSGESPPASNLESYRTSWISDLTVPLSGMTLDDATNWVHPKRQFRVVISSSDPSVTPVTRGPVAIIRVMRNPNEDPGNDGRFG